MKILCLTAQTCAGRCTSGTQVAGQCAELLLITEVGVCIYSILYISLI